MTIRRLRAIVPFCIVALSFATASAAMPSGIRDALQNAIGSPGRPADHVARDRYRHPLQTLEFFGMRPDMSVVEVLPGSGWYTEILAPLLRDHGHLVEASPTVNSSNPVFRKRAAKYKAKLYAAPAIYGHVVMQPFEPPYKMDLGSPDSADMIVTFRNLHDFIFANVHGLVSDAVALQFFRNAYRTLKPGGILGVVAHRAPADMPVAKSFKLGRLPQDYVIALAKRAGFSVAAASNINANPADPGRMPVWYLPPALAQGKKDRAHFEAIGEADNMTLRFEKPRS